MELPSFLQPKRDELGPVKAWSYSLYSNHKECAYRVYLARIEKIATESSEAASRGEAEHKALEDYIQGHAENLPNAARHCPDLVEHLRDKYREGLVEIEGEWAFSIDFEDVCDWRAKEAWVRMKLDALEFDDASMTSAIAYDWKTGGRYPVKHNEQGQLYAIAAFMRIPTLEHVTTRFQYLDKPSLKPLINTYSRSHASVFLPTWVKRGRAITHNDYWPPNPSNNNCRFCDFQKNKTCKYRVM